MNNDTSLLTVNNLHTYFYTPKGVVKAVNDVSFSCKKGETLALVGESGCGKTVSALSIMRLISSPGKIVSGEILFEGQNIVNLSDKNMRHIRGNRISMVFQEPMTSLNPVFTIGDQIMEVILTHQKVSKKEAFDKAIAVLKMVGLPSPQKQIQDYPHQLSGGMRQRVMIAMALTADKQGLMIADEPTTALDLTIQAQILKLMKDLQQEVNMALLLITHDMSVVAEMADTVVVMYAGKAIEQADVFTLYKNPFHPYTRGLFNSIPANKKYRYTTRLESIPGTVPNLLKLGEGCPFANRCTYAQEICKVKYPDEVHFGDTHSVSCHFAGRV